MKYLLKNKNVRVEGICFKKNFFYSKNNFKNSLKNLLGRIGFRITDNFFYNDPFEKEKKYLKHLLKGLEINYEYENRSSVDLEKKLKSIKPDVILVAGFFILPSSIYNKSKLISVNLHPSYLPEFRGPTPTKWVIFKGWAYTGISIHKISNKIDDGILYYKKKINIKKNFNFEDVERLICKEIPIALSYLIQGILKNKLLSIKKEKKNSTYFSSFNKSKKQLYWNEVFQKIQTNLNAMKPMTGLLSYIKNRKVCIWDIKKLDKKLYGEYGQIVSFDDNKKIIVRCKDSLLKIESFLMFGRIIDSKEITDNFQLKEGDKFK